MNEKYSLVFKKFVFSFCETETENHRLKVFIPCVPIFSLKLISLAVPFALNKKIKASGYYKKVKDTFHNQECCLLGELRRRLETVSLRSCVNCY
jgi:hypothetical protein